MPQSNIRLCQSVNNAIKSDNLIKNKLAIALNRSYPTIKRYANSNSSQLTTASALEVHRNELQKTNEELLNN